MLSGVAGIVADIRFTLDATPAMEIYCGSAQPWVHAGGERPHFE